MYTTQELLKSPSSSFIIHQFLSENEYLLPDPFSLHVDLKSYADKLNDLGTTFICVENEEVVGMVSGYINDFNAKESYLQVAIVKNKMQGKGCGASLIHSFIKKTKANFGQGTVFLTVDKSNKKAFDIYMHLGFSVSKRVHAKSTKLIMEYKVL